MELRLGDSHSKMNKQKVIKIWETLDSLFKNLFDHNHEISKENIEAIVDISNELMGVIESEIGNFDCCNLDKLKDYSETGACAEIVIKEETDGNIIEAVIDDADVDRANTAKVDDDENEAFDLDFEHDEYKKEAELNTTVQFHHCYRFHNQLSVSHNHNFHF